MTLGKSPICFSSCKGILDVKAAEPKILDTWILYNSEVEMIDQR